MQKLPLPFLVAILVFPLSAQEPVPATPPAGASEAAAAEAKAETPAPAFIELSVDGTEKVTKRIIWQFGNQSIAAHDLATPFSLDWVKPPEGAKRFVVVPLGANPPKEALTDQWISIDEKNPATAEGKFNLNISLRRDPLTNFDGTFGKEYLAKEPSSLRSKLQYAKGATGWTFIGSWSLEKAVWGSMYWVEAMNAEDISKRRRIVQEPFALKNKTIVSNYPMHLRSGPTSSASDVSPELELRPGVKVLVSDISIDVSSPLPAVWAQVTVQ